MDMRFSIYRYNPEQDEAPRMQDYELRDLRPDMMLLDALKRIKVQDETLAFRSSCGEGVCGSDGMNINGRNGLACTTPLAQLSQPVAVRPLSGMPVIRDLVVDLTNFWRQYREVQPWLVLKDPEPEVEPADGAHGGRGFEDRVGGCGIDAQPRPRLHLRDQHHSAARREGRSETQ